MTVNTEIIRKLAHSGLKSLHSLIDQMEFYDDESKTGLRDPETRRLFIRSIGAVAQAIRDLRLIAICDDVSNVNHPINWKSLAEGSLPRAFSRFVKLTVEDGNYNGQGHPELLSAAVVNLAWFADQFWKDPVNVRLSIQNEKERSWVNLEWNYGRSILVDSGFSSFPPYFPMFPRESLTLDKSTGLALCAVKRILEIHGGTLTAQTDGDLVIHWRCPTVPAIDEQKDVGS